MNARSEGRAPFLPERRGFYVAYQPDQRNYCPGCGREHWYVGRLLAECAFCGTAIPIAKQ